MSFAIIGLRPMHERPVSGRKVIVLTKSGERMECSACMVYVGDKAGIILYHKRKAIKESDAVGWWPLK